MHFRDFVLLEQRRSKGNRACFEGPKHQLSTTVNDQTSAQRESGGERDLMCVCVCVFMCVCVCVCNSMFMREHSCNDPSL